MNRISGNIALPASTGNFVVSGLGFTPTWCRIRTGGKPAGSTTAERSGDFDGDANFQGGSAIYGSSSDHFTRNYNNKVLVILSTPGGVQSEIALGTLVSFASGQATFNLTVTDNQYEAFMEFGDN